MFQLNRIEPALPVGGMKTYGLSAPQATHYRRASCREVGCANYERGWRSGFDVTQPAQAEAARVVRLHSGRLFTVEELPGKVIFTFGPGQECFQAHRVPLDREPILYVRDGDWRGNDTGRKLVHRNAEDWISDFGEHQEKIAAMYERG